MRVMNMLLDVAGINLEANVTPGDREILKKLEAEAEDQERKQKQTTMEHAVFGRKVQLLGRAVICQRGRKFLGDIGGVECSRSFVVWSQRVLSGNGFCIT